MDVAGLSVLLHPDGWAFLEALPPYDEQAALPLAERLRAGGAPAPLVTAALTQSRLRARAHGKFGDFADHMLFTPEGLEQATRLDVAAHHAQRFAAAGLVRVADLGCGIGGDAMALAGLDREVLAVDRDETAAAIATVNLRHWPSARVRQVEVADVDLAGLDAAWLDPARRTSTGRRVLDPHRASPPWRDVLAIAGRLGACGVKLAPGIPRDLAPAGAETQWVSVDGDVVEAAVWFGPLARPGLRASALVLRGGRAHEVTDVDLHRPDAVRSAHEVGAYVYDPDGAVVRSGLVGHVATAVGGRLLDPTIAYVTADAFTPTPLARAFAVQEVLPFSLKTLRTRLRDRSVGRVEILKRGSAVDVQDLRRQLRLAGPAAASLLLTRIAGAPHVIIARPVEP